MSFTSPNIVTNETTAPEAVTLGEKRKTRYLAATGLHILLTMREGASAREPQSLVASNYAHML